MSILNNMKENEFEKIVRTQTQLELLKKVKELEKSTPNDNDLGRELRQLLKNSK